jgi:hypothetical protein
MSDQVLIGRDWSEDFEHENGNYMCLCTACGNTFVGYKRRTTCKLCAQPEPADGVDVMAPDFSLDGGSQPCYYTETVERITAAHQAEVARLRGEVEAATKRARKAEADAHQAIKTLKGLERVAGVVSDNSDQVCGENNKLRTQLDQANALLVPVRDGYESSMQACIEDDNEYMADQWREKRDEIDAHLSQQAKP